MRKQLSKLLGQLVNYVLIGIIALASSKVKEPDWISTSPGLHVILGHIFSSPIPTTMLALIGLYMIAVPKYAAETKKRSKFINKYLAEIESTVYEDQEVRASLFMECNWWRAVKSNFYHLFIRDLKFDDTMTFGKKITEFFTACPSIWGYFFRHERYIYLKYRANKIHGSSRTFFKYSRKDEDRSMGIAGFVKCRFPRDEGDYFIKLPDITSIIDKLKVGGQIALHENIFRSYSFKQIFNDREKGLSDLDIEILTKYLRDSRLLINNIEKAYFKLQRINYLPHFIYAKCIQGEEATAVLVIDSLNHDVNNQSVDKKLVLTKLINVFETFV